MQTLPFPPEVSQRGWRSICGQCRAVSLCHFPGSGMASPQAESCRKSAPSAGSPWAAGSIHSSTWGTFSFLSSSDLSVPSVVSHPFSLSLSSVFCCFLICFHRSHTSLTGRLGFYLQWIPCGWMTGQLTSSGHWPPLRGQPCSLPSTQTLPCTPIKVINYFSADWLL